MRSGAKITAPGTQKQKTKKGRLVTYNTSVSSKQNGPEGPSNLRARESLDQRLPLALAGFALAVFFAAVFLAI